MTNSGIGRSLGVSGSNSSRECYIHLYANTTGKGMNQALLPQLGRFSGIDMGVNMHENDIFANQFFIFGYSKSAVVAGK